MTFLYTYFKGMLMGIADLVPGVSGGTIALITGIYQRLINAIASVNAGSVKLLFKGRIRQVWQHIDGWFLLAVFAGILSAIFLLASLIKSLLINHTILTWSFFFGLIVVSALLLIHKNKSNSIINVLLLTAGIALGYFLSTHSIGALPNGHVGVFLAGSIAICAMILPGISGSLLLILLGKYPQILDAVETRDWALLFIFAFGCLVGLLIFSRLLKWLLARHYKATIYTLAGLMLGTLFKVWPWKSGSQNLSPLTHSDPQLIPALLLMTLAGLFVWLLFKIDVNREHR